MKIAVVASNGKAAQKIISEAVKRGHDVTGFARSENKSEVQHFVKKDIMDIKKEDLKGFDAVVDAFGSPDPTGHSKTLKVLSDAVSGTDTRLLVVGGAGSMFTNKEHTQRVCDAPDFPDLFKPTAEGMGKSLDELRQRKDVKWTYISPAYDFVADGERTGKYLVGGEELMYNDKGVSSISYADYAIGMVDEIEKGDHIQQRIEFIGA